MQHWHSDCVWLSLGTTAKKLRFLEVPYNIPKRMRYYQAALDMSILDKGVSYNQLKDTMHTAKLMKIDHCDTDFIMRMTGLSPAEIEAL